MDLSVDEPAESLHSIYSLHNEVYHELHHREIRVVKLLSGRWSDKIDCRLVHASLANKPAYKALSYAWGSPRATKPILVNGYQHSVTVNLESALRRLRQPDSDLTLWVDALCINQSNNPERTKQVDLMHDIFSLTEEVIVYLGEVPHLSSLVSDKSISSAPTIFHCDDSDGDKIEAFRSRCTALSKGRSSMNYALDVFCFLRLLSGDPNLAQFPAFDTDSRLFVDSRYQRKLFEGLRQMMLCRWWNRIWVVQEVVVPKKVIMVYGSAFAPWEMFTDSARWILRNRSSPAPLLFPQEYSSVLGYFSRIVLDINRMRALWRSDGNSELLPLLRRFSDRKASDDRDKVFALLSLARNKTDIVADYTLSVPQVFQTTVLDIFKRTKSLTALAGDLGRKDRQDLPSWVPDWTAAYDDLDRRRADSAEKYNTTGNCQVYMQGEGDGLRSTLHYMRELCLRDSLEDRSSRVEILIENLLNVNLSSGRAARLSEFLGNDDWMTWLPIGLPNTELKLSECLAAVKSHLTTSGRAVDLQVHASGVLGATGLCVDEVAVTEETAYSEELLMSVVYSWAASVHAYFWDKDNNHSTIGLGDDFRRLLCANIIPTVPTGIVKHFEEDDHRHIATWFLQGKSKSNSPEIIWETLFSDLGERHGFKESDPVPTNVDSAIRAATIRRTLFITKRGRLGLGPAKIRAGDKVFILLGGQTPFVLREAGVRRIPWMLGQPDYGHRQQDCFEVVGDAYVSGMMDGEAMLEWKQLVDAESKRNTEANTKALQQAESRLEQVYKAWKQCDDRLSLWKGSTATGLFLRKLAEHAKLYGNPADLPTADEFEKMVVLSRESEIWYQIPFESGEEGKLKISDMSLDIWRSHFYQMRSMESAVRLVKVSRIRMEGFERALKYWKKEMDDYLCRIRSLSVGFQERGRVYLV